MSYASYTLLHHHKQNHIFFLVGVDVLLRTHLKAKKGIHVPRKRLRDTVREIRGPQACRRKRIHRRTYYSRGPLAMVHVDTHHKLIRYMEPHNRFWSSLSPFKIFW